MLDAAPSAADATLSPTGALMSHKTSTIQVARLNHYFGAGANRQQVLNDITLDFAAGQVVMMTGPSGARKTTLLTPSGALRTVQEGSVRVFGQEYFSLSRGQLVQARKQIGFIFQAHNLFSSLTAFRNVRMGAELLPAGGREMNAKVHDILARVGLADRVHSKPENLSGGQRQRVAVARALVNRPKLVLADEPTAALDKESATGVMTLLQELAHKEGSTVVVVTHDDRMMQFADRLIHLVDGHVDSDR